MNRYIKARKAYKQKDTAEAKAAHTKEAIQQSIQHSEEAHGVGQYIGPAVYGASDGIVTTFAVVSGVVGASLSPGIILILGFANLLADGFSMATGSYISKKSERDYVKEEYERELWETKQFPEEEKLEIREIYKKKGFTGKDLDRAVEIITSDTHRWVETMVTEELGLKMEDIDPLKSSLVTFGAFVAAGFMPLFTYVLSYAYPSLLHNAFTISILITGSTLFFVGSLRTLIIGKKWYWNGFEMLLIGGSASAVAYAVGYFLQTLA